MKLSHLKIAVILSFSLCAALGAQSSAFADASCLQQASNSDLVSELAKRLGASGATVSSSNLCECAAINNGPVYMYTYAYYKKGTMMGQNQGYQDQATAMNACQAAIIRDANCYN